MNPEWSDASVLITGGTGSLGNALTKRLLDLGVPWLAIFSRDELKQHEMRLRFNNDGRLRFFLGDVRDRDRLDRAFENVDVVIHAAALKQVPAGEYNPREFVTTNVIGTQNVVDAAVDACVGKVMLISTDKACSPCTHYGATKMVAERLFIHGNVYASEYTALSAVRYGNVLGSRGSVVHVFREMAAKGEIEITHPGATRFWLTLDQAVDFVLSSIERMKGREIFIPKPPSSDIRTLAQAIAPDTPTKLVGLRPGEKMHEVLISEDELRFVHEEGDRLVIRLDTPSPSPPASPLSSSASWGGTLNVDGLRALLEVA